MTSGGMDAPGLRPTIGPIIVTTKLKNYVNFFVYLKSADVVYVL